MEGTVDHPELYSKLDGTKREIRLLRIDYDQDTDGIHCRLGNFSLNDKPEYRALSYAWTKEVPTCLIYLNGVPFYVRRNLFLFLQVMHQKIWDDYIFIDALCINQTDLREKTGQVRLMRDIYSNAGEVIAWVGSSLDLDHAREINANDLSLYFCNTKSGVDEMLADWRELGDYAAVEYFVQAFCSKAYWSRLWIVQESLLASTLVIMYNNLRLPSDVLLYFGEKFLDMLEPELMEQVRELGNDPNAIYTAGMVLGIGYTDNDSSLIRVLLACKILAHRKHLAGNKDKMNMSAAIMMYSGHRCSVLHDKIFGLLGLTASNLVPDYSMEILRLYIHVLIECLLWNDDIPLKKQEDTDALWNQTQNFHSALLRVLDLEPFHVTVAFITQYAFRTCSMEFGEDYFSAISLNWLLDHKPGDCLDFREGNAVEKGMAWIRCRATRVRMREFVDDDSKRLPAYRGSRERTYKQWITIVDEICASVLTNVDQFPQSNLFMLST